MTKLDKAKSKYLQSRRLLCEYANISVYHFITHKYYEIGKDNPYLQTYLDSLLELGRLLNYEDAQNFIDNTAKRSNIK